MPTVDEGLERLTEIIREFEDFCGKQGQVTEADTRAKVIDLILKDVLGWPEGSINREEHVDRGFVDYVLSLPTRRAVVVEAKREGLPFTLPAGSTRSLKLSGALTTDPIVKDAVSQVRGYCDDAGIRHAIASNGYAWIVFRAIRDDMPWRDGHARVFRSLEEVRERFTEFWNLLSHPAVLGGSLENEFGNAHRVERELHRVGDLLFNADLPLQRNRLHAQLTPLIGSIFSEIADQDQLDILQRCYVHSTSLRIVASDLNVVISDPMPEFLAAEGTKDLPNDSTGAGFSRVVTRAMDESAGELFLILGGIGAGKTTFLKRYRRTVGKELLDEKSIWFNVDFLQAPLDPLELENFVLGDILKQLRERYISPHLETRRNIKRVFEANIALLSETSLKHLRPGSQEFEDALNPYLAKWSEDLSTYVPGLLRHGRPRRDLAVVLFIDNVDQLAPSYQANIFLLAERLTRIIGSVTIISLREESYYAASVQKTFTAYANRKFHVASPRFRWVISNRIDYALRVLSVEGDGEPQIRLPGGIEFDKVAIADFLTIVKESIFNDSRNVSRFIEAVCFGNMRLALQMFTTFLVSGATDVDKMLLIYRREGAYYVAFHEFVKSIMLGDRKYYRESQSPVMNVFDCGSQRNASHFTALRLIETLAARRGESTPQGQGYVPMSELITEFEEIFDNHEDVIRTMNRLVARQLVEVNTRSTESIAGAEFARLTSAGWYYRRYLVQSFSYLDLVLQDTPFNDAGLADELKRSVYAVDNLSDREDQKVERMAVRFERVERFIGYLETEEAGERERFSLGFNPRAAAAPLMSAIRAEFEQQRAWIQRRIRENREKIADEIEHSDYAGMDEPYMDDAELEVVGTGEAGEASSDGE